MLLWLNYIIYLWLINNHNWQATFHMTRDKRGVKEFMEENQEKQMDEKFMAHVL